MIDRWSVLRPLTQARFGHQYRRLLRHAGDDVLVFCQVGKFVELYGPQRVAGLAVLRLVRVWRPRAGFGYAIGFPVRLAATYELRALAAGRAVVHVTEGERSVAGAVRSRCVVRLVAPSATAIGLSPR